MRLQQRHYILPYTLWTGWPVEDERVLIDEDVKYIYDHLLAIPCDQRYDEKDMQRAIDIINNF